jgi:hypothetical protein
MLGFIAAIIFLLPLYLLRFSFFGIPSTGLEVLIYAAVVWLVVSQSVALTLQRLNPIIRRYGWPILLILAGSLIGVLVAPDMRLALGLFKAYILDPILLFGAITLSQYLPEQPAKADVYKAAFIALGVSLALSALLIPSSYTGDGRALGVFVLDASASPNFLALLLSPLATFSLAIAYFDKNKATRLWGILGFAIMAAGLWATASRGGLLAVGSTVVLMSFFAFLKTREKQQQRNLIGVGIGVVVVGLLAVGWLARPDFSGSASVRATTSNNIRYEIWRTTLVDMVPSYGLQGVGLGGYQSVFTRLTAHRVNFPQFISPWAVTPHNIFLTWWMNIGILGLIGFIWIIVLHYDNVRKVSRGMQPFAFALGFGMLALLLHGIVDAAYWKNDLSVLFWLFVSLSHVSRKMEEEDVSA